MSGNNTATNLAVEVSAFSVTRALGNGVRRGIAGLVVQPVVWAVSGNGPDAGDAFIYGMGAIGVAAGAILAIPAAVTGMVKAVVDDHIQGLVDAAKLDEPQAVRGGIFCVDEYSFAASGGHIQAMTIAGKGGVAWEHPNGVYLFMRDAAELPVCDYRPRSFKTLYKPLIPLQPAGDSVRWTSQSR